MNHNTLFNYLVFILLFSFINTEMSGQRPYITRWKTDNFGNSEDNQILIPSPSEFGYTNMNYEITWVEVDNPSNSGSLIGNGVTLVTFPHPGIYEVSITPGNGNFSRVTLHPNPDVQKLISVEQWGDIEWITMHRSFYLCRNLEVNATDAPDLSKIINTKNGIYNYGSLVSMFEDCLNFDSPIGHWDVSNPEIKDMSRMFSKTKFNQDLNQWNVSNVENMTEMFSFNQHFDQDLDQWDVSNVRLMTRMFNYANVFNGDISTWDVSKVSDMISMFSNAIAFNRDLNHWDVSKVEHMASMFNGAINFNGNIRDWHVSKVRSMSSMFKDATSFNNEIGDWNVSNVNDMSGMFYGAQNFNIDIGRWNLNKATNISHMFLNAKAFDQDISSWDVSNVQFMISTFQGATSFNQDISDWNVSEAYDLRFLFEGATSFDQDLSKWEFRLFNYLQLGNMFDNCGISCTNYDSTLIAWSQRPDLPLNRRLGTLGIIYNKSSNARQYLIDSLGWIFEGDIYEAGCGAECNIEVEIKSSHEYVCLGDTALLEVIIINGDESLVYNWSNGLSNNSTQYVSPTVSTVYTLTVTDSDNCFYEAEIELSVIPEFEYDTSVTHISCVHNTGSISISTSDQNINFVWSSGDTTHNIDHLIAGNYIVSITDSFGCISVESFQILKLDSISLDLVLENESCSGCNNGTATVNPTGGQEPYQYLWSNGLNTQTIQNLSAGNYSVTVTDSSGCTAYNELNIIVSVQSQELKTITIFPNPVKNEVNLNIPDYYTIKEIKLLDINGLQHNKYAVSEKNTGVLQLSNLASGIYFITVITENNIYIGKFIKL